MPTRCKYCNEEIENCECPKYLYVEGTSLELYKMYVNRTIDDRITELTNKKNELQQKGFDSYTLETMNIRIKELQKLKELLSEKDTNKDDQSNN